MATTPFLEFKQSDDSDFTGTPNVVYSDIEQDVITAIVEAHLWNLKDELVADSDIENLTARNVYLALRNLNILDWIEVKSSGTLNPDGLEMEDDAFTEFVSIGESTVTLKDIPPNCARKLFFRVKVGDKISETRFEQITNFGLSQILTDVIAEFSQ